MQVCYLVVKMSPVSARIIPDTLYLPLKVAYPLRLILNRVPEINQGVAESVHPVKSCRKLAIQIVSEVLVVIVVHAF